MAMNSLFLAEACELGLANQGEGLSADYAGRYQYWQGTFVKLDTPGGGAPRWVETYTFLDGRGAPKQVFKNRPNDGYQTQDVEYDVMGRAYRASNPHYTAGYGAVGINSDGLRINIS
jgi:hypothetical protein